jgi:hypothetical protein
MANTKTNIRLENYSKEVLISFIKHSMLYRKSELDRIKHDLEFEKLMKQSDDIRKEMAKNKGIEKIQTYAKLMNKDRLINNKIDKLLGLGKVNIDNG